MHITTWARLYCLKNLHAPVNDTAMTDEQLLQKEITQYTDITLMVQGNDAALFRQRLAAYVNRLITGDFNKLVYILYRLDISEKRLKQLLASQQQTDAGLVIANMIIERQLQKIQSRKQYRVQDDSIPEEEKW